MARGNEIVVQANPLGRFVEGFVNAGESPKPGQIMQYDPTQPLRGGRFVWKLYNRGADGNRTAGPLVVVTGNNLIGGNLQTAYAPGDRVFGYIPAHGDELNVLLADVAGTADAHAAGEVLMVQNATGKMIATTGTPQSAPFILNEAIAAPVADTLAWVTYA